VNPFADSAKGGKIHDENASKTFPFQERIVVNLGVNSNGMGYGQIYPFLKEYYKHVDGTAAFLPSTTGTLSGSATFTSIDVPDYSSLNSDGVRYRIVSYGIRVISLVNAMDAQGRIIIRELDADGATQNSGTLGLSDNTVTIPHTHDMDLTIIPNHVGAEYKRFRDFSRTYTISLADGADEPPFRAIGITCVGFDPSSSGTALKDALSLEVVYNLEILPKIGTIGMRLATDPAPHSNTVQEAVSNTRASLPLVHHTPSVWSKVKKFAKDALVTAGQFALGRITGGVSNYLQNKNLMPQIANYARDSMLFNRGSRFITNG
jgi:hypothetical protein